jgi:hypothetical protein
MNKMARPFFTMFMILVIFSTLLSNSTVIAKEDNQDTSNQIVDVSIQAGSITWTPTILNLKGMTLKIAGPNGFTLQKQYEGNIPASLPSSTFQDGSYLYEIVLMPKSHAKPGDAAQRGLGPMPQKTMTQSGAFSVAGGAFVTAAQESLIKPQDVVNADDVIVQGSICAGFDCVNNESFGFDTIRLKENNLRIGFMDTSVSPFPTNDWTIVANDTASGGASFLGFEDVTGAKFPFKVMAGAPTNSLFVSSNGDLGIRTSTPVLDVHATTTDTPGVRLEQTNAGGFSAQTWDMAGNEANFFIRDVTGGSLLSFRIRPGAPTSSLDIAASGNVGIGTASPAYDLDVANTGANTNFAVRRTDGTTLKLLAEAAQASLGTENNFPLSFLTNNTAQMTLTTAGALGIGTTTPAYNLELEKTGSNVQIGLQRTDGVTMRVVAGAAQATIGTENNFPVVFQTNGSTKMTLATSGSLTVTGDVNATAFNPTSDRNAKENFAPINNKTVLERLAGLPITTWNFIENDNKTKHMGPMAQDFHAAFGLGADDKHISTTDADGVAFAAIQELNQRNQTLSTENATLRSQVNDLSTRMAALESGAPAGQLSTQTLLIILLVGMNLGLAGLVIWFVKRGLVVVKAEK